MGDNREKDFYASQEWLSFSPGHPGGKDSTLRLLNKGNLKRGDRVLDLCCGTGDSVRICQEREMMATGVDRPDVIRHTRVHDPENQYSLAFDAVLCECSLSLLEDQQSVLREIRRVLKPGGRLLLSDVHCGALPLVLEGFECLWWEDAADTLRSFAASWLWETGSPFPAGCGGDGYFLSVYRLLPE